MSLFFPGFKIPYAFFWKERLITSMMLNQEQPRVPLNGAAKQKGLLTYPLDSWGKRCSARKNPKSRVRADSYYHGGSPTFLLDVCMNQFWHEAVLTSHTSSLASSKLFEFSKLKLDAKQCKMLPFWPRFTGWANSEYPSMKNVILKAAMVSFVPLSRWSVSQTTKWRNIKNEKVIVTGMKKTNQSYSLWLSENLLINLLLKGKFDSSSVDHRQELDSLGLFNGIVAAVCFSNILQGNYWITC